MSIPKEVKDCVEFVLSDIKQNHNVEQTFTIIKEKFSPETIKDAIEILNIALPIKNI